MSYRYQRLYFYVYFFIEEKALNGLNFINVRLRCETNAVHKLEENVKTLGSNIVKKTGVSLEGNEIYVRSVQSESKEKGTIIYVLY